MNRTDGGPAFPIPHGGDLDGYVAAPLAEGMSLRDWFAGQALAGWLCSLSHPDIDLHKAPAWDRVAKECYTLADAMLEERER